ncbi:MAG TPA: glycosyltransferase [Nostocaceae cyanobacterium]|nr:glycosyltransferase [Nostocaceae cyanobacterium]
MLKVLHIIPSINPLDGGTNLAAIEMVKALRKCGVDAEIATTNDNGSSNLEVPLQQLIEYNEVPVQFFSRFLSSKFRPVNEFKISWEFTGWLESNITKYHLIHIHSFFSYLCTRGGMIARKKNVNYVITPHGQLDNWVINQKRLKKEIYSFLWERANLNNAAGIHCTTANEANDARNFGIVAPIFTVPLGVTPLADSPEAKRSLRDRYQIPDTRPIILFLSRLHPKKRPDLLLQSLSQIKDKKDFHLILAGSGDPDYEMYLTKLVADLKLDAHTTLTGFVQGKEKTLLLQGSDIFVLPSFGENFAIAVAEAMAAGLPVIITPEVQISSQVLAENAGLVVPGELNSWVEAITKLLDSAEMRHTMGSKGKNFALRCYDWHFTAEGLAAVYTKITQKQPTPNTYLTSTGG